MHSQHSLSQSSNIQICCDRDSGISSRYLHHWGSIPKFTSPTEVLLRTSSLCRKQQGVVRIKADKLHSGLRLREVAGVYASLLSSTREMFWWSQKEPNIQGFCPLSKGQDQRNYRLVRQFSARENHGRNLAGAQLTVHKIISIDCGWVNHVSPRQLPAVITYMYLWLRGKVWMFFTLTLAWFLSLSPTGFFCVVMVSIAATSEEWEKDSVNFTQKVVIDG